jgi:cytochrome b561
MPPHNTATEYGLVTKTLHWVMVVVMAIQFVVGYLVTRIDDDHFEGIGGLSEDRLLAVHMSLGATILALATIRLGWRLASSLPAWASTLTHFERVYSHWVERALYLLMFAIPLSGMLAAMADGKDLVFFGLVSIPRFVPEIDDFEDLALALHILSHLAFFGSIALHVGLVIKHQVGNRDRLLDRML